MNPWNDGNGQEISEKDVALDANSCAYGSFVVVLIRSTFLL